MNEWSEIEWLKDHLASLPDDHPLHAHIENLHNEAFLLRAIAHQAWMTDDEAVSAYTRELSAYWQFKHPAAKKEALHVTEHWIKWMDEEKESE